MQRSDGVATTPPHLTLPAEPTTGITLGARVRLQMSSWFGRRWSVIDGAVQDTTLPLFWVEVGSQARPSQLRQFAPLLWAQRAQRALRAHAHVAAAAMATAAVFALAAGIVLRQGGGDVEVEAAAAAGGDGSAAAAQAAADVRQPLLPASYPVTAEEEGLTPKSRDVEQQQQGAEQQVESQPGFVAGVLGRLPLLGRLTSQGGEGSTGAGAAQ